MPTPTGRRARPLGLVSVLAMVLGAVLVAGVVTSPARAQVAAQTQVVSDNPVNWTPHVLDGQVNAVVQVGTTAVVGGTFTQVQEAGSATVLDRAYLFAVDTTTGHVLPGFAPILNDEVESIAVAPGGSAVIVGGGFTTVNGVTKRRIARINVATGQVDTGFTANANTLVQEVVVRDGWLYASGKFTSINNSNRSGLARLDPATGAVDPALDLPFTAPPRGTMGVPEIDVSPDGTTLVAVGNFSLVGGQSRIQIAMLDLTTSPVSVASWQTDAFPVYNPNVTNASWCSTSFDSYMRDIDFAPDGSYFVVATTGSNRPNRLCDTVTRWETSPRGPGQQPTWADASGGDSFIAVGVTGSAVYAGGHQQWMNNPYIAEACGVCPGPGPGGIPRQGIAALDPVNGLPFTWDPGRTRGIGVFSFLATDDGLWVGSDTDVLGGETHRKLGFFPLAGGISVPPNDPYPITADLFSLDAATGNLVRRTFDGTTPGAGTIVPTGVDWRQARGAFALNGKLYTGWSDGSFSVRDFDGTTVSAPTPISLNGLEVAPPTIFKIPGTRTAIPSLSAQLAKTTGMFFDKGRLYYTVSGDNRLYYRYFTPQSRIIGASLFVASTGDGVAWSKVRGMTMSSGQLVFSASGKLYRVAFDGRPVGAVTQIGGRGMDGINYTATGLFSYQP